MSVEYYPRPNVIEVTPAQPSGLPVVFDKTRIPFLNGMKLSNELVIYRPPPSLQRARYGFSLPVITVQIEKGPFAFNFHDVAKNAVVDADTQLIIPEWQPREPTEEEIQIEKDFEAREAHWEDCYWTAVEKHRELLLQQTRERVLAKKREPSVASLTPQTPQQQPQQQQQSPPQYSRADSFRRDISKPASPNQKNIPQLSTKKFRRKPPVPVTGATKFHSRTSSTTSSLGGKGSPAKGHKMRSKMPPDSSARIERTQSIASSASIFGSHLHEDDSPITPIMTPCDSSLMETDSYQLEVEKPEKCLLGFEVASCVEAALWHCGTGSMTLKARKRKEIDVAAHISAQETKVDYNIFQTKVSNQTKIAPPTIAKKRKTHGTSCCIVV